MTAIVDILKAIANIIASLIQFIVSTLESLFSLFSNLPQYLSFVTTSINVLPAVIIPFALASISIFVIYLVIGRN